MTPGLERVGGVVVLHGAAARAARDLALIALRSRRANGLPPSPVYSALAQALAVAVAVSGQTDDRPEPIPHCEPQDTITVADAAALLGCSPRQARRLAPLLGGRRIGGRWLLDAQAVREHREGKSNAA